MPHDRHGRRAAVRIGIVCPYSWDVPGGVQSHVRDLAEELIRLGHEVLGARPGRRRRPLPPYVVLGGPGGAGALQRVGGPAVLRLPVGGPGAPLDARGRVRRAARPRAGPRAWACSPAGRPTARSSATFHTSNRALAGHDAAYAILQTALEKISARIAVSEAARDTLVEHLGGDAVLIPNGVSVGRFADGRAAARLAAARAAVGFLGRIDEPRKGLPVLLDGTAEIARPERPGLRLLVAGPGDVEEVRGTVSPGAARPGRLPRPGQRGGQGRGCCASVDVFVAPNTGGESFGIMLLEAMAAGAPVLASDLDAFRRVLDDGTGGALFPTGPGVLAERGRPSCSATRRASAAAGRRRRRGAPATTGSASPADIARGLRDRRRAEVARSARTSAARSSADSPGCWEG